MTGGQHSRNAGPRPLWRAALRHAGVPLGAGVVLAILAPFGTGYMPVAGRLLYWVGLTLGGGLGASVARWLLQRAWTGEAEPNLALRVAVQTLGATAAVSPFVFWLTGDASRAVFLTLFYIAVISAVISLVGELSGDRETAAESAAPGRPPLLDRLPPRFRSAELHAVSSEDHYVRVHTSAGEHMLLMRLGDAQDLAAPVVGVKPHRSWWVAEGGAQTVRRVGERWVIELPSGVEVPVSRNGAKALREAGWV